MVILLLITDMWRQVAIDEEALDQQLLSTGITDRNIDEFLGLIEQRIDDLIQVSNLLLHWWCVNSTHIY